MGHEITTNSESINIDTLPVIQNNLLRSEHVRYNIAWHDELGDQYKVIYPDMGPDICTVLLFTNASEIIAPDNHFTGFHAETIIKDYATKYWHLVDKKPIPDPDAFGYAWKSFTAESYVPKDEDQKMFDEDLFDRKSRGYWNHRAILNFGTYRLLAIELKRLGVDKNSIKVAAHHAGLDNFSYEKTEITFNWAYPGENEKPRKIIYVPPTSQATRFEIATSDFDADCYYQKGGKPEENYKQINESLPVLADKAVIAMGYQFEANKDNNLYSKEISKVLGHRFIPKSLDNYYTKLIDDLPESDPLYLDNAYGMKMHVFERNIMTIRKYRI